MSIENLEEIVQAMVAPGKGIIAVDESLGSIEKRFKAVGLENTKENRLDYREMLLSAKGLNQYISGAILFEENLLEGTMNGKPLAQAMVEAGIMPGVKVDKGTHPLAGAPGEVVTEGLDGLRERLQKYAAMGAKFAKWRAVIKITDDTPTSAAVEANTHALARYAALCQEAGLVPMVEPEVLMDDKENTQDIDTSYAVHKEVLQSLFAQLELNSVMLEGLILKTSMVIPGKYAAKEDQVDPEDVAEATVRVFKHAVPAAVGGIVFLSGGQDDEQATRHLDLINKLGPHPWPISFSYGRALVSEALSVWSKNTKDRGDNYAKAHDAVLLRAKRNSEAAKGALKD